MITLTLSRKDLVDIYGEPACGGGLALFNTIKTIQDNKHTKTYKTPHHKLTIK
jgi:hypothetical protein